MAGDEPVVFEQMLIHNLKAPMTGILASLEMLHDEDHGPLTDSQRSTIASMRAQGSMLVRMIDELLDLGRVGSPGFRAQRVPIDLSGFMVELRAEWAGRLPRLTVVIDPDVPDAVGDVELLRRVFENLLMNASVHAGRDATVTLRAERAGDIVRILVADDGPGIAAADAERIFDPFVTLDVSGGRPTHGLGLTYCRSAVVAMGGEITLASSGRGATFVVALPAAVVLSRQALEQDQ